MDWCDSSTCCDYFDVFMNKFLIRYIPQKLTRQKKLTYNFFTKSMLTSLKLLKSRNN